MLLLDCLAGPRVTGLLRFAALPLIVSASLLVFSPSLKNGFVNWDDQVYVVENWHIKHLTFEGILWFFTNIHFRSYVPLTMLSHAVDYHFWGLQAKGHHLTNLLLHAVNSVWVYFLVLLVLDVGSRRSPPEERQLPWSVVAGAAFAALLFSLHPLRVESVSWVSDRKDLLCAFFLYPSYLSYITFAGFRGTARGTKWCMLSLMLFACALLSKPSAMTAPVVLILLDIFVLERTTWQRNWRSLLREKVPYVLLSILAGVIALLIVPKNITTIGLDQTQKLLLPFYALAVNFSKFLWPVNLAPLYDNGSTATMFAGLVVIVLLTALCVVLWKLHRPFWLVGWLYYIIVSIPTSFFGTVGIQPIADRYTYISTLSFYVLAGWLSDTVVSQSDGSSFPRRWRVLGLFSVQTILLVVLGLLSVQQINIWRSSEALWRRAMLIAPATSLPYSNLGCALADEGRFAEAIMLYQLALQRAPDDADVLVNLGVSYYSIGEPHKAVDALTHAIQLRPDVGDAYVNLGEISLGAGRLDEARSMFDKARQVDSHLERAYFGLGLLQFDQGNLAAALPLFEQARSLNPDMAKTYYYLGLIHLGWGEDSVAVASLVIGARLGDADARKVLQARGGRW